MSIEDISSRLTDIEKNLFEDPRQIKDAETFDFLFYLIRAMSLDNSNFTLEIATHCPDILEATLDKLFRDIEV